MNPNDFLKDWIINFARHRDILAKNIVEVIENPLTVRFKDKEIAYMAEPKLSDGLMQKISENKCIVTFNTKENFVFFAKHFNEFSKFKGLVFYFVNPFSNLDNKWIIHPYVHAQIADTASLKTGLKAMFEIVDPISEEEINEKFK
ncbi:MAG: hypothetical protein Q7J54_02590 [Candidatus Woesearchaeota archaeon]|nr:hypothetical protein [Candidatus Woesearchaeota archaeon]